MNYEGIMYNEESKMANSILKYIKDTQPGVVPEEVYNGWAKTDKNGYSMSKQERVKAAYRIIQTLMRANSDDIEVMSAG